MKNQDLLTSGRFPDLFRLWLVDKDGLAGSENMIRSIVHVVDSWIVQKHNIKNLCCKETAGDLWINEKLFFQD